MQVVNLVTPIVPHYQELYRSALDSLASADILTRAPSSSSGSSNNSSSGSGSNISSNSNIDMYTFTQVRFHLNVYLDILYHYK